MKRNDAHSPSNYDPADYEYVGSFDQHPEAGAWISPKMSEYETVFGTVEALTPDHADFVAGSHLLI